MILQELKDFSNETSIHGPSQIGNDKSSIVKRLLWLGIFLGCLAYGAHSRINNIHFRYISKVLAFNEKKILIYSTSETIPPLPTRPSSTRTALHPPRLAHNTILHQQRTAPWQRVSSLSARGIEECYGSDYVSDEVRFRWDVLPISQVFLIRSLVRSFHFLR